MYRQVYLTPREEEIMHLIKDYHNLKDIAEHLGISYRTLQWHLSKLYAKLGVRNKLELILELIHIKPDYLIR